MKPAYDPQYFAKGRFDTSHFIFEADKTGINLLHKGQQHLVRLPLQIEQFAKVLGQVDINAVDGTLQFVLGATELGR